MNKIIVLSLIAAMILCGCEKIEDGTESVTDELAVEIETTAAVSETETEHKKPDIETASMSGEYVFDDAGVLSEKERQEIYNEVFYISCTYKINCAVVTADKLDGMSASEYAEAYYKKLYNGSNGVMFLINNDTGDDYILRKGALSNFVTSADIEMLYAGISPLLVTGKYSEAVKSVFSVLAEKLPQYAIDRTNKIEKEEVIAVNSLLAEGSAENESLSIIFIGNIGTKPIEDYAKEQYNKYFALDSGSNALMVVNTETAEYCISGTALPAVEKDQGTLKKDMDSCLTVTGGKKSFNCEKAAEIFVNFMRK